MFIHISIATVLSFPGNILSLEITGLGGANKSADSGPEVAL